MDQFVVIIIKSLLNSGKSVFKGTQHFFYNCQSLFFPYLKDLAPNVSPGYDYILHPGDLEDRGATF